MSGTVFVAHDIIFDEHLTDHTFDSDSDDAPATDVPPATPFPLVSVYQTTLSHLTPPAPALSNPPVHCSAWMKVPTATSSVWNADIAQMKAHLQTLCESCAARIHTVPLGEGVIICDTPGLQLMKPVRQE